MVFSNRKNNGLLAFLRGRRISSFLHGKVNSLLWKIFLGFILEKSENILKEVSIFYVRFCDRWAMVAIKRQKYLNLGRL